MKVNSAGFSVEFQVPCLIRLSKLTPSILVRSVIDLGKKMAHASQVSIKHHLLL